MTTSSKTNKSRKDKKEMKKYRLYRKIARIEYKDVMAKDEDESLKSKTDGKNDWKCISSGLIVDAVVTQNFKEEEDDVFIQRDIANL